MRPTIDEDLAAEVDERITDAVPFPADRLDFHDRLRLLLDEFDELADERDDLAERVEELESAVEKRDETIANLQQQANDSGGPFGNLGRGD